MRDRGRVMPNDAEASHLATIVWVTTLHCCIVCICCEYGDHHFRFCLCFPSCREDTLTGQYMKKNAVKATSSDYVSAQRPSNQRTGQLCALSFYFLHNFLHSLVYSPALIYCTLNIVNVGNRQPIFLFNQNSLSHKN